MLNASPQAPHGGGGSGGSAPCCGMSGCPSLWHRRRPLTTALNEVSGATCMKPHGDRGPPVQRPRTMLYGARRRVWPGILSSSRCTRTNSGARGLTGSTRSGRKAGYSGTPWNRLSTPCSSPRRLMFLCRRWMSNWWRCAGSSMCVFPSRSSKCPRSHLARPCRRRVRFAEQTAEQLVEVPTIISYSSLQRTAEQNVDIPVGRGGRNVGLQGFPPKTLERSSERTVEQIVDSRVLGGVSPAFSSSSREHAGEGVFSTFFPGEKSAKVGPHSSPRVPASVSPSTSSAHLDGFFIDENDDVWMRLPSGQWMLLGSDQHVLRDEPG